MNHESKLITIFTDGSSRGNPGPGGFGAIVIAPKTHDVGFMIQELGGREDHTTNNRMELMAAIKALQQIQDSRFRIRVFTDSRYLINGITKWVFGWQKNNWKTVQKKDVENKDLWEHLIQLSTIYRTIDWQYIGGHVGIAGNTRCDGIATAFADGKKMDLYSGPIEAYPLKNILTINIDEALAAEKSDTKNRSRAKAYSYLSMIDGAIKIHATWAECEARVKGVKGARFKKALDVAEEKTIMSEWSLLE